MQRQQRAFTITDRNGKAWTQVENFGYLGSVIHAMGGSKQDIKARTVAAWTKWHDLTDKRRHHIC